MVDAAGIGFILKAAGYGVPVALLVFTIIVLPHLMKYMQAKQDKDRREHMAKWESMISIQQKSIDNQKNVFDQLIEAHKEEINRLITSHNEDTRRRDQIADRQAAAIEAVSVHLTTITNNLKEKHFCPTRGDDDGK
jgi:hypothetical protein